MKENRSITGKQLILIGSVVITLVMILSVVAVLPLVSGSSKGYNFLRQLFEDNEEAAMEYVSSEFLNIVRLDCTRSVLTGCLEDLVPEAWGDVGAITFVTQASQDEVTSGELYHLDFSRLEAPASVVLLMREQDGTREVVGWRGWVVSEGEAADAALASGERHDHELITP